MEVKGAIYKELAERIKNMNDDAAQKIIDEALAEGMGPEDFGGEDYPQFYHDNEEGMSTLPEEVLPHGDLIRGFPPIATEEEKEVIKKFYSEHPIFKKNPATEMDTEGVYQYNPEDAWIQTYSGRRFTPTNPNPDAIVIQDIAHSLSMQCRFGGHTKSFYSVAQHCVLVSYICNFEDALWGLMHDATEAYLVDVPRPIKRSGLMDAYLGFEDKVQEAICKRFGLIGKEPASVKRADTILLATEARDLLPNLRTDWSIKETPLPFKINPLGPREAKDAFMKRFFELTNMPGAYEHYLHYENLK